jgi:hypothetical protein
MTVISIVASSGTKFYCTRFFCAAGGMKLECRLRIFQQLALT